MSLTACVLTAGLGACTPAPTTRPEPDGGGHAALRAADARIAPGDRIVMHVVGEPLLTDTMMVNERGEAAFAKLGVMNVSALSIARLQDTLRAEYARYLRNPALELIVLRRIAVNGEVKNPDVYLVDVSTTLRDVIAKAGGLTEQANASKVEIVRDGARTRVPGWQRDRGVTSDLRSGDQVIVGRKNWLLINLLPATSTAVIIASLLISLNR